MYVQYLHTLMLHYEFNVRKTHFSETLMLRYCCLQQHCTCTISVKEEEPTIPLIFGQNDSKNASVVGWVEKEQKRCFHTGCSHRCSQTKALFSHRMFTPMLAAFLPWFPGGQLGGKSGCFPIRIKGWAFSQQSKSKNNSEINTRSENKFVFYLTTTFGILF